MKEDLLMIFIKVYFIIGIILSTINVVSEYILCWLMSGSSDQTDADKNIVALYTNKFVILFDYIKVILIWPVIVIVTIRYLLDKSYKKNTDDALDEIGKFIRDKESK